jgi:hypothetical protein
MLRETRQFWHGVLNFSQPPCQPGKKKRQEATGVNFRDSHKITERYFGFAEISG